MKTSKQLKERMSSIHLMKFGTAIYADDMNSKNDHSWGIH